MFGKTFTYRRLNVSKGEITDHTVHAHNLLDFLYKLNKWNAESGEKIAGIRWIYWTKEKYGAE